MIGNKEESYAWQFLGRNYQAARKGITTLRMGESIGKNVEDD